MDKKGILLIILCLYFFTITGVSAENWENMDFDGYFSMKVPDGVNFEKEINITDDDVNQIFADYFSENIVINYIESPLFSDNSSVFLYQSFFESLNPESLECYESQEDNLTILEPLSNDGSEFSLVGLSNGNKIIIIMGDDVQLIKGMGRTIEFK